jgi:hypothetical protein
MKPITRAIFIGQPQLANPNNNGIDLTYGMTGAISIWDTLGSYFFWPDGYKKSVVVPKSNIYFPRG